MQHYSAQFIDEAVIALCMLTEKGKENRVPASRGRVPSARGRGGRTPPAVACAEPALRRGRGPLRQLRARVPTARGRVASVETSVVPRVASATGSPRARCGWLVCILLGLL